MRSVVMGLCWGALLMGCGDKSDTSIYLQMDSESAEAAQQVFGNQLMLFSQGADEWVLKTEESNLVELSAWMHQYAGRCGGFFALDGEAKDLETSYPLTEHVYSIDKSELVEELISEVNASSIKATIEHLSSFHNRYYQAPTGTSSQQWLYDLWQSYGAGVEGFDVELYEHASWSQPSVIATWRGSELPNEVIVIGGHGDSISGYFNRVANRAPGADDNASGVASVSEAMRIMLNSGIRPARTIKFMSYAAEEVGLRGSQAIAQEFRRDNANVVAVMQLDMTNFAGSGADSITFIRDFTSNALTDFTIALYERYIGGKVINDTCGYACSDHASWHRSGYPAVFPFEARSSQMNPRIHTPNDTLQNADREATHARAFSQLLVAFAVEVAK